MNNDAFLLINVNTIKENIKTITEKFNDYKYFIGVVKGNCYGHGFELLRYIKDTKINYFAVATIDEAMEVRKYVNKNFPVLILQPIKINDIKLCIENNLTITISNMDFYYELTKENIKEKLKFHLKLNTGMNRFGIDNKSDVNKIYNDTIINKKYNLIFEGIYTHLATLGIVDNYFDTQVNRFKYLTEEIDLEKIKIVDLVSSNALVIHKKFDFANGCRIGEIIFGNCMSDINKNGFVNKLKCIKRNYIRNKLHLSPINETFNIHVKYAISYYTNIIEIHNIKKGSKIGYDANYVAENDMTVAVIPVGYYNGFNVNYKHVFIKNKIYNILDVNMCISIIEIDNEVSVKDNVYFFNDKLNIKKVTNEVKKSMPYLLSTIPSNIKRIYKD